MGFAENQFLLRKYRNSGNIQKIQKMPLISKFMLFRVYTDSENSEYGINEMVKKAKLLKAKDIAEDLDVSTDTVNGWADKGLIPAYRIGSSYRIREDEYY